MTSNRHYTPRERSFFLLVWSDRHSLPRLVRQNVAMDPKARVTTERRSDIYYTLNHAHVRLHCPRRSRGKPVPVLTVNLETETPWFSHYEVRTNGSRWRKTPRRFTWDLHNGKNVLDARPVNRFGRKGIVSHIAVRCEMR